MDSLERPTPPTSFGERARAWIEWFGVGRLVVSSVATIIVCVGAYWLVRTPPPPTEASLPMATVAPSSPVVTVSATTLPPPTPVVVHVAGSVIAPGVYELAPGARVRDAISAAGGPIAAADSDRLNLASPIPDGTRIYVPAVGEEAPTELLSLPPPIDGGAATGPVDVDRATASELEALPGVGPATATAIITERERNGPFLNVDDLERVPGIGPAKLEALRELVTT